MKTRLFSLFLAILGIIFGLFSCQKAPELTLSGPSSIELSADGSKSSFTITANRDWTARSSESWIIISPSSGTASDGPITITVSCAANTTYDDRTATITVTMEELTQTVSVRQPANLGIVLPTQSFDLQSDSKTIEVEVQANVQYTVSTSADWIKQTGTKGLTSKKLTFSIAENKTYDPREGKITIKPQQGNVQEQVVTVRQAQKDALNVEKTSYEMPYGGGGIEIKVEANVSFDVTPNVNWIHYVETKALNSSTIYLTVDENETYSAREGKIEISQKNGTLKHTVTVKQAGRIAVSSIELNKTELKLEEGATETLTATVKPDNATDKTVTWSSSDANIATVDDAGKVTAIKAGTATITAQAGEKTAKCTVTVYKEIPATSVDISKSTLSLIAGDEVTLTATPKPDNTTETSVTWTSSNGNVATVDANGKVKAIAKGNAVITAKVGSVSNTCKVFVKAAKYPTPSGAVDLGLSVVWASADYGGFPTWDLSGYYLWGDPTGNGVVMDYVAPELNNICDTEYDIARMNLGKGWRLPTIEEVEELLSACTWQESTTGARLYGPNGETILLRHTGIAFPADGPVGTVALTSKDKGFVMTGESTGSGENRMAFAYQFDKNFSYNLVSYNAKMVKFPVRPVFESLDGTIPVSSVSLNKTELSLKEGESETLTATISPSDATDNTVTWSTSDASIATVSNGKVTAVKEGSAYVTARAGEKSATCTVTVQSASDTIPDGAVDLGIEVTNWEGRTYTLCWSDRNIGANTPEEYGDYYAWGETQTKEFYDWTNYIWCEGSSSSLTKYTGDDHKYILERGEKSGETIDDVARAKLGGKWRMPHDDEWYALRIKCTWTKTTRNGVNGFVVTGPNGNSIFLPLAGRRYGTSLHDAGSEGSYWSSFLKDDKPTRAYYLKIQNSPYSQNAERCMGLTVRAVIEK